MIGVSRWYASRIRHGAARIRGAGGAGWSVGGRPMRVIDFSPLEVHATCLSQRQSNDATAPETSPQNMRR
jgi:hypothetical protein